MYKKKELKKYRIRWTTTISFESTIEAEDKESAIQIIDEDFDSLESDVFDKEYVDEESVYAETDIDIKELDV